ncbi:MAG TPA: diguanylate cyclase [Gammaproteobacteria bacterium]|nr:diguanylate cyclase [Gammaproteobacteria bacterium]
MSDKAVVLIVDDAPSNAMVLAACLKDKYYIKVARSGAQCLDILVSGAAVDLILLDIEMPGMNGYEVCEKIKSDPQTSSVPIIFVTGKNDDEDQEKGLSLGAVDYIVKPIRAAIVAARVKTHVTLKRQHDRLQALAMRDQLTNLYNRHYFLEVANHKVARAIRHKGALSLLMIDIDYFKSINDNYGHPVGDQVLKKISELLLKSSRKEDVVARFGGEEFVILMDQCDIDWAGKKAGKLRERIEVARPNDLVVTASIGVAQLGGEGDSFDELLKRADAAVYRAKEQGRNRIVPESEL